MDQSNKRRELVEKFRQSDKVVKPKPRNTAPQTMFQHFSSEEARMRHLMQVEEGIKLGAPF